MIEINYCPAYLLNKKEYESAEHCLNARGCSEEQVKSLIALAKLRDSEIVVRVGEAPPDDFIFIIAEDDAMWRTWIGRSNAIRDTREAAEQLVESFSKDVEWRIFDVHHNPDQ